MKLLIKVEILIKVKIIIKAGILILTTDASGFAIGGILSQGKIGKDKLIAHTSRSLNDCERKYDTHTKKKP